MIQEGEVQYGMTCSNIALIVLSLFALTCGLCIIVGFLLPFNPLLAALFLFLGTLGVVVLVDVLQAFLVG